jgi:hypothetical protein
VTGTWIKRLRTVHTWLGVFFSPLLLLFIVTGWWQTYATDETKDHGPANAFLSRLSDIHTDDYFKHGAGPPHASTHFKLYVSLMAVVLIVTILLGLALACQTARKAGWAALAFGLGVAVPIGGQNVRAACAGGGCPYNSRFPVSLLQHRATA